MSASTISFFSGSAMKAVAARTAEMQVEIVQATASHITTNHLTAMQAAVILPAVIQPIEKKSVTRQGLLFYNDSDSGPLQGNFAELDIDTNLSITANMYKLNPVSNKGILLYLANVKLPEAKQPLIFQNEFMNINRHGVMIWVQDIIGVVAVNLHFDLLPHRVMFGSDTFENPIIYKGKTHLTHSMVKPEKWGVLKSIEVLELSAC